MYVDKLDDIVNQYNNTNHRTMKIKSVDGKPSIYTEFNKKNNKEGPKFKISDQVRVSKYKNIVAKDYIPNWLEEVFLIRKVKNIVLQKCCY